MVGEMRKWEARAAEARSVEAEARAYAEDAELQAHRWHCDAWEAHVRNNSRLKRERWTARLCARTLCIICQYYTDIYRSATRDHTKGHHDGQGTRLREVLPHPSAEGLALAVHVRRDAHALSLRAPTRPAHDGTDSTGCLWANRACKRRWAGRSRERGYQAERLPVLTRGHVRDVRTDAWECGVRGGARLGSEVGKRNSWAFAGHVSSVGNYMRTAAICTSPPVRTAHGQWLIRIPRPRAPHDTCLIMLR